MSNLLGNAVTHGAPDKPIYVESFTTDTELHIRVANGGEAIPPEAMQHLFHPFVRAKARASHEGLGLGLYIASEIAKAHGGTLTVTSTGECTEFTFRMPLRILDGG